MKLFLLIIFLFLNTANAKIQDQDVKSYDEIRKAYGSAMGNVTLGSRCLHLSAPAPFIKVGQYVTTLLLFPFVIPNNTTVSAITPGLCAAGEITLSNAAMLTISGQLFNFGGPLSSLINTNKIYVPQTGETLDQSITDGSLFYEASPVVTHNFVFAGPITGSERPSFRALTPADVPYHDPILWSPTGVGIEFTYITPPGAKYLKVKMTGAGGGGQSGCNGVYGYAGGDGDATYFGSYTVPGGKGGDQSNVNGGKGGEALGFSDSVRSFTGGHGSPSGIQSSFIAGAGGNSFFGQGGTPGSRDIMAGYGDAGSGGGGGCATSSGLNTICGQGGGAGAYAEILITSPASSYPAKLGFFGAAGDGGGCLAHLPGGGGGFGVLTVEAYFQ